MTCQQCGLRDGTERWVGSGGVLAYVHGAGVWWCQHCVVEAQLTYARELAATIPDLERRLAALQAVTP